MIQSTQRTGLDHDQHLLGIPEVLGMNVYDRQTVQNVHTAATGTSFRTPTTKTYEVKLHGNESAPWQVITESSVYSDKGHLFTQISQGSDLNFGVWKADSTQYSGFMGWFVDLDDYKGFMEDAGFVEVAREKNGKFRYYGLPNEPGFEGTDGILLKLIDYSDAPSSSQANQTPVGLYYLKPPHNVAWSAVNPRAVSDQFQRVHGVPYNQDYLQPNVTAMCFNDDGTVNTTYADVIGLTHLDVRYVITEDQDTQIKIEHTILTGTAANPIYPCTNADTPIRSAHRLGYSTPDAVGTPQPPSHYAQQMSNAGMRLVFDISTGGSWAPQFFVTRWRGPGGLYYEIFNGILNKTF